MKNALLSGLLSILVLFLFVSCTNNSTFLSQSANDSTGVIEETNAPKTYRLFCVDGKYYLSFSREESGLARSQLGSLSFDSLDDLIDSIKNNRFADWEYDVICSSFPKDENGIKIFNLDRVLDAKVPNQMRTGSVSWQGDSYSFNLRDESGVFAYFHILSQQDYSEVFNREYETLLDRKQITVSSRQTIEDRNAEVILCSTDVANTKLVRYTLPNGVIVEERYRLSSEIAQVSETIPSSIHLYSKNEDGCFVVSIGGLKERPTVDWLSQFGVKSRTDD